VEEEQRTNSPKEGALATGFGLRDFWCSTNTNKVISQQNIAKSTSLSQTKDIWSPQKKSETFAMTPRKSCGDPKKKKKKTKKKKTKTKNVR
jgi:hypothetical protein